MTGTPLIISRRAALCLALCLLGPAACRHGAAPSASGKSGFQVYASVVNELVKKKWRFPKELAREKHVAVVEAILERDGRIFHYELAESSGDPEYDASCMKAFADVERLPAPPAGLSALRLIFNSSASGE